jgi:hypothetical protein
MTKNSYWTLRSSDLLHPRQLDAKDLPIQEQERSQRLLVRRRCHVPFSRQVAEESLDFRRSHQPWVS